MGTNFPSFLHSHPCAALNAAPREAESVSDRRTFIVSHRNSNEEYAMKYLKSGFACYTLIFLSSKQKWNLTFFFIDKHKAKARNSLIHTRSLNDIDRTTKNASYRAKNGLIWWCPTGGYYPYGRSRHAKSLGMASHWEELAFYYGTHLHQNLKIEFYHLSTCFHASTI